MSRCFGLILVIASFAGCERASAPPDEPALGAAPVESPEILARSMAGYDVVIMAIDGLRADRVGAETTPFLSELGQTGLRFEDAASNSSYVLQSLASFFTGRLPTAGGTIGAYEAEPHEQTWTLAQHFSDAGYYTGMLANHPAIQGAGFTKGFKEIEIARPAESLDDARLVKRAAEFLEDAGNDRVFLYVHLAGVLASPLYSGAAADGADDPLSVAAFAEHYATAFPPSEARVAATVRAYDDAMRAADGRVRELVEAVRESGRAEKTLFVVTSLHGFELFEHGGLGSGWTVFEESIRVPLILHAQGAMPEAAVKSAASLADVMPTMLTLTGIDLGDAAREGRSLFALEGEQYRFVPTDVPRIAEVVIPERCIVRSATLGDLKWIESSLWTEPAARFGVAQSHKDTANAFADGSRPLPPLWGGGRFEALYDLRSDPGETQGTTGAAEDVRAAMEAYRAYCAEKGIAPRIATQFESAIDEEQLQNLESLGYL